MIERFKDHSSLEAFYGKKRAEVNTDEVAP